MGGGGGGGGGKERYSKMMGKGNGKKEKCEED